MPDSFNVSIKSPVAKLKVNPLSSLRSLLSTIAVVKSIVYVVFGFNVSCSSTFTLCPAALMIASMR